MDTEIGFAAYLKDRVDDQIAFFERAAARAKRIHLRMQTAILLLGVMVPVMVNLPTRWGGLDLAPALQAAVTLLSVALAGLNGLASFHKHGELWLSYRAAAELLKNEKLLFLTRSGPYRAPDAGLPDFVERVEALLSSERTSFRSLAAVGKGGAPPAGTGMEPELGGPGAA